MNLFTFIFMILSTITIKSCSQSELNFINKSPFQHLYRRNYSLFTNWLDCNEKVAVLFYYEPLPDKGNEPRLARFKFDPLVPKSCQQKNSKGYGSKYDRGHLVPANHMDFSNTAIAESNYMTNIVPQYKGLNVGAWLETEAIIECLRDTAKVKVWGGIIMGNDKKNDIFLDSHGIRTPDWFWKVIYNQDKNSLIAWIMPNNGTASRKNIDKFLVSVDEIERKTGFIFTDYSSEQKRVKLSESWKTPKGCDLSK